MIGCNRTVIAMTIKPIPSADAFLSQRWSTNSEKQPLGGSCTCSTPLICQQTNFGSGSSIMQLSRLELFNLVKQSNLVLLLSMHRIIEPNHLNVLILIAVLFFAASDHVLIYVTAPREKSRWVQLRFATLSIHLHQSLISRGPMCLVLFLNSFT